MLLTEEEEEKENRFMTEGEKDQAQQPKPENPANLIELYRERKQIIEGLFYQGIGKPIYVETDRRTRVDMNRQPGDSYMEISEIQVVDRRLIGVALPTGEEGEYLILGEDLDQVVVRTKPEYRSIKELAGELGRLFGPEGEGIVLSLSNYDSEKPLKAILRKRLFTAEIISSIDDPERVQSAVTSAIKQAKTEAKMVLDKKIKNAQIANDAFRDLLQGLNFPEASSPSDEEQQ